MQIDPSENTPDHPANPSSLQLEDRTRERLELLSSGESSGLTTEEASLVRGLLDAFDALDRSYSDVWNAYRNVVRVRDIYHDLYDSDEAKLSRIREIVDGPVIL